MTAVDNNDNSMATFDSTDKLVELSLPQYTYDGVVKEISVKLNFINYYTALISAKRINIRKH
ncbi:MAG: hypothetical protein UT63_C0001G0024 [Candidatus Gottesmanbacteria bacterium GW2011_GWC2_39_8]|uniref:Uncharacterized protein n=1 Tax=Candidatus Gottesmanbacteria bacterium GW2011_GWC2_39_8 TaxID=1618450 RepID=A0A0G0T9A3_9BACT|nr:MAG: hypothetical protein UT63_C0001G0024 [Candidatus Gottesmanbacteria bacterium GW2011_GWC2_39_8]